MMEYVDTSLELVECWWQRTSSCALCTNSACSSFCWTISHNQPVFCFVPRAQTAHPLLSLVLIEKEHKRRVSPAVEKVLNQNIVEISAEKLHSHIFVEVQDGPLQYSTLFNYRQKSTLRTVVSRLALETA